MVGVKWLVDNCKDKIMANFTITEGGWNPMRIGNKTCHFVQAGEKGTIRPTLKARGVSSHGSVPMFGDNAVAKMANVVKGLAEYQPQVILTPEVKQLIQAVAKLEGIANEIDKENIDQVIHGLQDRILAGYLTAITRMTVSPNVIHGGVKVNIVPDTCEAEAARRQSEVAFSRFHMALLRARHEQSRDIADVNTLIEVAKSSGLEIPRFQEDLSDRQLLAKLAEDHTFAVETLGVFGTPTLVFLEGQAVFLKMMPAPPPEECLQLFKEIRHLAEQRQYVQEVKRPARPRE